MILASNRPLIVKSCQYEQLTCIAWPQVKQIIPGALSAMFLTKLLKEFIAEKAGRGRPRSSSYLMILSYVTEGISKSVILHIKEEQNY